MPSRNSWVGPVFFFQAEDGIRDVAVTGVQTCALPISFQTGEMPKRPLRDWGKYRWQDEVLSVVWLYNRTGNRDLLRLAELLRQQGYNWRQQFANFSYTHKSSAQELGLKEGTAPPELAMQTHGVNNAMGLKSSALSWLFSKQDGDRDGVQQQLDALDRHQDRKSVV